MLQAVQEVVHLLISLMRLGGGGCGVLKYSALHHVVQRCVAVTGSICSILC
jgi:hypothetical protein